MLKIRLSRHGKKSHPCYWIVVAENTAPRDGRFIQKIGHYQPTAPSHVEKCSINEESFKKWISNGAIPTERVAKLAKNLDSLGDIIVKYIPKEKFGKTKKRKGN